MVVKQSRLQAAGAAALELVKRGDPSVSGWQRAHDAHMRSLDAVVSVLKEIQVPCDVLQNPYAHFDPSGHDLVIVVGGDGTFLSASHSVGAGKPMLGINSDPDGSRGFFCGLLPDVSLARSVEEVLSRPEDAARIDRMSVSVQGTVRSKRVLNEALLCHPNPAATSRYSVCFQRQRELCDLDSWEDHVSSGFWIGPGAGSTGAMSSAGGTLLPLSGGSLQFVAREVVRGQTRKAVLHEPVVARAGTDRAVVHMDGPFKSVDLSLGDEVRFAVSDEPLTVLGI